MDQAFMVLAEQLINLVQISKHCDLLLSKHVHLDLIDINLVLDTMKPLLKPFKNFQSQPVVNIGHIQLHQS